MKTKRIALAGAIIIIVVALFVLTSFKTISYDDYEHPLMVISNMDNNRTHSVLVFVANDSCPNVFEGEYVLAPGEWVTPAISAPVYEPEMHEDYNFRITVDGEATSEMPVDISATRIAAIDIEPQNGNGSVLFSFMDVTLSGRNRYFWEQE